VIGLPTAVSIIAGVARRTLRCSNRTGHREARQHSSVRGEYIECSMVTCFAECLCRVKRNVFFQPLGADKLPRHLRLDMLVKKNCSTFTSIYALSNE
jgi:hypothetical protein